MIDDEDFGFECIPLQTVCNDDDTDNDDIYFLDEFGNYVFPVSTPTIPGSCSCPPSAEDLAANSRRVSQVMNDLFRTSKGGLTSKGGSIGSMPACGPRDSSSNPAWGKLV